MSSWKTPQRKCQHTQKPFCPGDTVLCFVYQDAQKELARADILASHEKEYAPLGPVLARWKKTLPLQEKAKKSSKDRIQTALACFTALFESTADSFIQESLKTCLGLFLERKGVLKRTAQTSETYIFYETEALSIVFRVNAHIEQPTTVALSEALFNLLYEHGA